MPAPFVAIAQVHGVTQAPLWAMRHVTVWEVQVPYPNPMLLSSTV